MGSSKDEDSLLKQKKEEELEFRELLDKIEGLDIKEKFLWKKIYQNAIDDRESADALFMNIYEYIRQSEGNHQTHGDKAAKYLEAMSRANEQLLKLSGLVRKAIEDQDDDSLDLSELFGNSDKDKNGK